MTLGRSDLTHITQKSLSIDGFKGAKTESVPLGELKILAEQRQLLFDEEIMCFTMGNSITLEDTNGNRKLMKRRREQKIDNVAAIMDAYVAWKANKDLFD